MPQGAAGWSRETLARAVEDLSRQFNRARGNSSRADRGCLSGRCWWAFLLRSSAASLPGSQATHFLFRPGRLAQRAPPGRPLPLPSPLQPASLTQRAAILPRARMAPQRVAGKPLTDRIMVSSARPGPGCTVVARATRISVPPFFSVAAMRQVNERGSQQAAKQSGRSGRAGHPAGTTQHPLCGAAQWTCVLGKGPLEQIAPRRMSTWLPSCAYPCAGYRHL